MSRTAIILGASGLTGSYCLQYLLDNTHFGHVFALVRNKLGLDHPKLHQIVTDFTDLDVVLPQIKADDVFSCMGTTIKKAGSKEAFLKVDLDYPLLVAKLARKNGARGFHFVSAVGANNKSFFFYNRAKAMLEEEVMQLHFENTNILRPSILDGERNETRPGEKAALLLLKLLSPILRGPFKNLRPTKARAVGYGLVKMAVDGIKGLSILEPAQIEAIYKKSNEHN